MEISDFSKSIDLSCGIIIKTARVVREDAVDSAVAPSIGAALSPREFRLEEFRVGRDYVFQHSRIVDRGVVVLGSLLRETCFVRGNDAEVAADQVCAVVTVFRYFP